METQAKLTVPPTSKDVIIIGGSLSALMHGIMLHRLGHSVRIFERSSSGTPVSHMAGVCLGADVLRFLERFDGASEIPLGIESLQLQAVDHKGQVQPFLKARRVMSSWDALYFRLRANFDALASSYVPSPPSPAVYSGDGESTSAPSASYETGKEVIGISEIENADRVLVTYKDDSNAGRVERATADLVIGADGPNSVVRRTFLKTGGRDRKYAGYVAWRGVVPEDEVSSRTRDVFRTNITYSLLPSGGGHVILYNIPGEDGAVAPGKRLLNFCWYTNVEEAAVAHILTNIHGERHHTKLPPGLVQPKIWEEQKTWARTMFPEPYLEVMDKIESPFLHLITDYQAPRASFAGGKVLLVGDAMTLLRPHIAFSTNQAASHALLTERLLQGSIDAAEWEYQITTAAGLHWKRSVWFGQYFQRPLVVSMTSAVSYWFTAAVARFRIAMGWLEKQTV